MALVLYGGGIAGMSGSIGGDTHARNRSGPYVRARTKPVNPNSTQQGIVRATLTSLVERWAETLTAVQRTAWELYASNLTMKNRLSQDIHLTGMNHYVRSNANRTRFGIAEIDAGPVVFALPDTDPAFAVTFSEAGQTGTVIFDDTLAWPGEDDAYLHIFMGAPQNPQRNFFGGPWRFIHNVSGNTAVPKTSPQNLSPPPFPFAEGQRVWCYARIARADGRISTPFYTNVLVAA